MATTQPQRTRRERQRQATYDEIVAVSRRLLRTEGDLSLRAVAGEMGMTPPALYRYVDSYRELLVLVARHIFTDVVEALTAARDRHPDEDPAAQLIAASAAFRRWAMDNTPEFGLIFANAAATGENAHQQHADAGTTSFAQFFADIFLRVWQRYEFDLDADDELDPAVEVALREGQETGEMMCTFPGQPLGLCWAFIRCWGRLYGTVTLEVFQRMDPQIIDSGALFRATLEDNAYSLNLGDWPRLRQLLVAEMQR